MCNATESQEMGPHKYSQLTFNRGRMAIQLRRIIFPTNGARTADIHVGGGGGIQTELLHVS